MIRQIIGFIYLTIFPGYVLLKLLNKDKIDPFNIIAFSIGLSLFLLMFIGYAINLLLPILFIQNPISLKNLVIAYSLVIFSLTIFLVNEYSNFHASFTLSHNTWIPILLPVMACLGAYSITFYGNTAISFILIFFIILIVIFNKRIDERAYTFYLFAISLSLLLHTALISPHIPGYSDTYFEYYFAKTVIQSSQWNWNLPSIINSMLSCVMIPSVYSEFLNIDAEWVFRIIYQIIYSIVPLCLFYIYNKLMDSNKAFLSALFFIFTQSFFWEMPFLMRQQIAEFFLSVLLIIIINKYSIGINQKILMLAVSIGIIVSHYSIAYIVTFLFIFMIGLQWVLKDSNINRITYEPFIINSMKFFSSLSKHRMVLEPKYIFLYIILLLSWYIYTGSSSVLEGIINIGHDIAVNIYVDFLDPNAREPATLAAIGIYPHSISLVYRIQALIFSIIEILLLIGFISMLQEKFKKLEFYPEFCYASIASMLILLAAVVIPLFATRLNITRLFHIMTICLSPFFVLGGISLFTSLENNKYNPIRKHFTTKNGNYFVIIIMIMYFLFNIGFIPTIAKDASIRYPLGINNLAEYGSNEQKASYYSLWAQECDVRSSKWISSNRISNNRIYADDTSINHVLLGYGLIYWNIPYTLYKNEDLEPKSYIYLRSSNIEDNIMLNYGVLFNYTDINLKDYNKIYRNGRSDIYLT